MMTEDHAPPGARNSPLGVPFSALPRQPSTRTSVPTNDAVRAAAWRIAGGRGGRAPLHDAVIFAALRLADPQKLAREVALIEDETFVIE